MAHITAASGSGTVTVCDHKPTTGCALVALAVCCACADKRPFAPSYPVYIDGQGMRMQGKRWSLYCWRCRDYWDISSTSSNPVTMSQPPRESISPADQALSSTLRWSPRDSPQRQWSFNGIPNPSQIQDLQPDSTEPMPNISLPQETTPLLPIRRRERPASEIPPSHNSNPQIHPDRSTQSRNFTAPLPRARRRPLPNPFGTREEIEAEDYQSPLEGMFTRAWNRYRAAEQVRRANPIAPALNTDTEWESSDHAGLGRQPHGSENSTSLANELGVVPAGTWAHPGSIQEQGHHPHARRAMILQRMAALNSELGAQTTRLRDLRLADAASESEGVQPRTHTDVSEATQDQLDLLQAAVAAARANTFGLYEQILENESASEHPIPRINPIDEQTSRPVARNPEELMPYVAGALIFFDNNLAVSDMVTKIMGGNVQYAVAE